VPSKRLPLELFAAAAILGGCGGEDEPEVVALLDERAGSYRGVRFGDSEQDVQRQVTEPLLGLARG
jgi:hypothetical protein